MAQILPHSDAKILIQNKKKFKYNDDNLERKEDRGTPI